MQNISRFLLSFVVVAVALMSAVVIFAAEPLVEGFQSPPQSARPRVWWHWMNGNISKEGIRKDLEWMKRVGIGGTQNFDGAWDTTQVVDKRLVYMTPEWKDAFRYAATLADQLGLELAIASSPGWSETGGPWVKPQDGMKKLVWSATRLAGARRFTGQLAAPPSVTGPFQTMPRVNYMARHTVEATHLYRDVAVIAYRTPRTMKHDPEPVAITTSAPSVDGAALRDGNIAQPVVLPNTNATPAWVLYDFGQPRHFRAVSIAQPITTSYRVNWMLEASDDGKTFRRLTEVSRDRFSHMTVSFPAITVRFLRLITTPGPDIKEIFDLSANAPGAEFPPASSETDRVALNELQFYAGARVHRFEDKAGFSIARDYHAIGSVVAAPDEEVDPKDVIDLTGKVHPDGMLVWTPPSGDWTVLRLGYSLIGTTNHPASAEATGLEVDKLDKRAVEDYMETYLDNYEKAVGAGLMGQRGIQAVLTDSIESAGQNWTPAMIAEFKARRGYDMAQWFPVLTGVIVGDAARSDRFLWDFRKTLMELMSDAHYRQVAESAHKRGLVYYGESLEGQPALAMGDDLDMRQYADIPMAAIWTSYKPEERDGILKDIVDIRGAASVAHVFGQNLVAAESLTSVLEPWAFSPATLRPVIDLAFALGVNRPVIHTSVHQPVEKKPGMTLGPFGQQFTRHETWAEMAGPWVTYLSRTAYLLQQGRFVADVAWFYGEDGPLASRYTEAPPADLPEGHGYDFINANILLNHLRTSEERLVSSGGAEYRLLYLGGNSERMTLQALRKLKEFSDHGIAIAGRRPVSSPSLADEGGEEEYRRLVAALWDGGKVIDGGDPNEALAHLGIMRDFDYEKPKPDSHVMFVHRKLPDGEIYFLTNRKARPEQIEARLRITERRPELWHADTGKREAVSWRIEQGRTVVPLKLQANQSLFVVFGERTDKSSERVPVAEERVVATLEGEWQLSFEPGRGAPPQSLSTALTSWTESPHVGVKYFSGVGTYQKTFNLRRLDLKGRGRVIIDLGQVHELAEVTLNGKPVGTAWHAPFRLDVTGALKPGTNSIEIRVANLWVNRLIGDKQPGATPLAFTTTGTYKPDAPLRLSGLMGPVRLIDVAAPQ